MGRATLLQQMLPFVRQTGAQEEHRGDDWALVASYLAPLAQIKYSRHPGEAYLCSCALEACYTDTSWMSCCC